MKRESFFLTRWWSGQNLQTRLVLVFTSLFVFCVLTFSFFLLNVVQMISLNNLARTVFEENRQIYQLETLLKQYDLGLKQYEVSASSTAEEKLSSLGKHIDEKTASLRLEISEDDLATLDKFIVYKTQLTPLIDQVLQSVDEEDNKNKEEQDWSKVQALDGQADNLLGSMYTEINIIGSNGVDELEGIKSDAEIFSMLAYISGLLSVPAFLFMAAIVILTIYLQINLPVEQLASAAKDLQSGKFNPAQLEKLAGRNNEIGILAREFILMAASIDQRKMKLQQEADEIRAKIR
jgi:methyl-accepting chemotaxis protein